MQWQITGAHRQTGDEKTIVLEAHDQAQAERRATRRGLLIENVIPLTTDIEVDAPDQVDEAPAAVEYQREPARHEASVLPSPKRYMTLLILASTCGVIAGVALVISIGMVIAAWSDLDAPNFPARVRANSMFNWGVGGVIACLILLLLSDVAVVVRDIARNSCSRR